MPQFDRVIIGAGLAGLSLVDRWLDQGGLPAGSKVAMIDPNPEAIRDRTFAYWRAKGDQDFRYSLLADNHWEKFRITPPGAAPGFPVRPLSFGGFVYERITGAKFYEHVNQRITRDPRIEMIPDIVVSVAERKNEVAIRLSSGAEIYAGEVWSTAIQEAHRPILQHFLGYEIELDHDFFDDHVVDLMDFRVPQFGETRFVYILPFSRTQALVEFTAFSPKLFKNAEYERELKKFLARQLGLTQFRITRTEQGVISMALDNLPKFSGPWIGSKIHPIGAAAGMIKPSTGYSFSRNQKQLSAKNRKLRRERWRFYVYDALLLGIIRDRGASLAHIFPQLFARNTPDRVFQFLNEETRLRGELPIFYRLPWGQFLKNLLLQFPFVFGCLLTWIVFPYGHSFVPLAGLVVLGISHGSVDHELSPKVGRVRFFSIYLLGMAAYGGWWWWSPSVALSIFLAISIHHFGEGQFARALKVSYSARLRLLSYAWGAFATLGAPLFHWDESLPILRSILRKEGALAGVSPVLPFLLASLLAVTALVAASLFDRYEYEATARPRTALPATGLLVLTFWGLPLLPGFLCYFAFWHSADSIQEQRRKLDWRWGKYLRKAFPLTAVSWLAILTVLRLAGLNWGLFFVALGALTFSHAPVMSRFYGFKKEGPGSS